MSTPLGTCVFRKPQTSILLLFEPLTGNHSTRLPRSFGRPFSALHGLKIAVGDGLNTKPSTARILSSTFVHWHTCPEYRASRSRCGLAWPRDQSQNDLSPLYTACPDFPRLKVGFVLYFYCLLAVGPGGGPDAAAACDILSAQAV